MVDRVKDLLGTIPEARSYTDFYELEALGDTFVVAFSTALAIGRELDHRDGPEGLEFQDVFGTRHRLPARCAYRISEGKRANLRAVGNRLQKKDFTNGTGP